MRKERSLKGLETYDSGGSLWDGDGKEGGCSTGEGQMGFESRGVDDEELQRDMGFLDSSVLPIRENNKGICVE